MAGAVLFVVLVFMMFLSAAICSVGFTKAELDSAYERHHSAEIAGISDEKLAELSTVIYQFISGEGELPKSDFSATARGHMDDVEKLFRLLRLVFAVSSLSVLWLLISVQNSHQLFRIGATGALLIMVLLGIVFFFGDFQKLFVLFHEISFSNDMWILDPNEDVLIRLLPMALFRDLATKIVIRVFVAAAGFTVLSWIIPSRALNRT